MKLRTFFNSIKESLKNMVRHPLVSLASITTMALMLILMGSFICLSFNVNHIAEAVGSKPPLEIWVDLNTPQENIDAINAFLGANSEVAEFHSITPAENFASLKEEMGEDAAALANFDGDNLLPHLFTVRLHDPDQTDVFVGQIKGLAGVNRVDYSSRVMEGLASMIHWVNLGTLVAFGVLCVITLFIIYNMVRVSIMARGEEISIMKYVGATNSYIRLPYILEGALVGLIGAGLAVVAVYFGYQALYARLMVNTAPGSFYALLQTRTLVPIIVVVNGALGVLIGATGSFISVRKYIKV